MLPTPMSGDYVAVLQIQGQPQRLAFFVFTYPSTSYSLVSRSGVVNILPVVLLKTQINNNCQPMQGTQSCPHRLRVLVNKIVLFVLECVTHRRSAINQYIKRKKFNQYTQTRVDKKCVVRDKSHITINY